MIRKLYRIITIKLKDYIFISFIRDKGGDKFLKVATTWIQSNDKELILFKLLHLYNKMDVLDPGKSISIYVLEFIISILIIILSKELNDILIEFFFNF